MEETPGSFRRLNEDEARSAEWPTTTLPPRVNGQPREDNNDDGGKEGKPKAESKDKGDHSGHKKDKGGKKGASASLPRPKREGKPSLFNALTWSKGKKSRPKLPAKEGAADLPNDEGLQPGEVSSSQPPQQAHQEQRGPVNNVEYSERGVDVPDDKTSPKTASPRLSSTSSSGSSEPPHPIKAGADATSANKTLSTSSNTAVILDRTRPAHDTKDRGPRPTPPKRAKSAETQPLTKKSEAEAEARETGATPVEGEASRGETYYDTGRRFRLEATVMVDDEKPAERRVTYLGPVLLSPLGKRQGQYVHVTVAPGSATEASDGSSLLVRPARPVLIHSNSCELLSSSF